MEAHGSPWRPAAIRYACLFPALITDWRAKFDLPSLSFAYVELASYANHDYTHLRQAQRAALQLPFVAMATAVDLGDMASPHGGIHPRRKQEVGRRLALAMRGVAYDDASVAAEGPRLTGVQLSRDRRYATLSFAPSTAARLHLTGTAECKACCAQPPPLPWYWAFEVLAPNRTWIGALASVHRTTVQLHAAVAIGGVRYAWNGAPDCMLYNGEGGGQTDSHDALVAPPFRRCFFGTSGGLPDWHWLSDCLPAPTDEVAPPRAEGGEPCPTMAVAEAAAAPPQRAAPLSRFDPTLGPPSAAELIRTIPTASVSDWVLSPGDAQLQFVSNAPSDERTTGRAIQSGAPQAVNTIASRYLIGCGNAGQRVDSVNLSLRFALQKTRPRPQPQPPGSDGAAAAPSLTHVVDMAAAKPISKRAAATPAATPAVAANVTPATLTITLANLDTHPIATVLVATNLTGLPGPPSGLPGPPSYSAPLRVNATGLQADCGAGVGGEPRGRLQLHLTVANHDQPVLLPLDDLVGGLRLAVGWTPPPATQVSLSAQGGRPTVLVESAAQSFET